MRVRGVVLLAAAVSLQCGYAALVKPHLRNAIDPASKRLKIREDIAGILGGLEENHPQEPHRPEQASTVSVHTETEQTLGHPITSAETPRTSMSKPAETLSKSEEHVHTEDKPTAASNLVIGTPPPTLAPPTATATNGLYTSSSFIPTPTGPAITGLPKKDGGPGPDWKVIGVAVIAVSVVGTAILCVVFFDQWSRFMKDVCTGRRGRRRHGKEELVPDWHRGSWTYSVGEGEGMGGPFTSPDRDDRQGEKRSVDVYGAREALEIPPRPFFRPLSNPFETKESLSPGGAYLSPAPGSVSHQPMRSPSPRHDGYPSPSVTVVEAHATGLHRSNSTKTTITEDAYGGMAVDP